MKKQLITTILLIIVSLSVTGQTNWYVSKQNGSNSNDGLSAAAPFETVEYCVKENNNFVQPGDTVFIMDEYTNNSYDPNFSTNFDFSEVNPSNDNDERINGITNSHLWHGENTIRLNKVHGQPNNYITFKPYDANTILKGDGGNILRVQNCSYIKIEGFEIEGEVEQIPLNLGFIAQFIYIDNNADVTALTLAPNSLVVEQGQPTGNDVYYRVPPHWDDTQIHDNNADYGGPGWPLLPSILRPSYTSTRGVYVSNSHHVQITENLIHHMPGGGLRLSDIAYSNAIDNEIHNCSRRSYGGTHALVVTKVTSTAADVNISGNGGNSATNPNDDTTNRIQLLRNKIHFNFNEVYSWAPSKTIISPHLDEGKGISLQRNRSTDAPWSVGRMLVANNVCYWNGFSGVHSNDGDRIDFINNSVFMNSYTASITLSPNGTGGNIGISASNGIDVTMKNNISVIDGDLERFAMSTVDPITVENNILWSTGNNLIEDADIVAVQVNTTIADPLFVSVPTKAAVVASANPHLLNFDLHLQSGSPAIDYADASVAPLIDFDGVTRSANPEAGAFEYSGTNSLSEDLYEEIKNYPNPFNNAIYINNKNVNTKDIQIHNLLGQSFTNKISITKDENIKIDTQNLDRGVYIIRINNTSKIIYKL